MERNDAPTANLTRLAASYQPRFDGASGQKDLFSPTRHGDPDVPPVPVPAATAASTASKLATERTDGAGA